VPRVSFDPDVRERNAHGATECRSRSDERLPSGDVCLGPEDDGHTGDTGCDGQEFSDGYPFGTDERSEAEREHGLSRLQNRDEP
jgi:hypothetical protein